MQSSKTWAFIGIITLALGVGLYVWHQYDIVRNLHTHTFVSGSSPSDTGAQTSTSSQSAITPSTETFHMVPIMSPGDTYGLFSQTAEEKDSHFIPNVWYKDDGIVPSGKYEGYHLIIGLRDLDVPGDGIEGYFFATKDYNLFIVQAIEESLGVVSTTDFVLSDYDVNFNKVAKADFIVTAFPQVIDEGAFVLVNQGINITYPNGMVGPSSTSVSLKSSVSGLRFFSEPPLLPSDYNSECGCCGLSTSTPLSVTDPSQTLTTATLVRYLTTTPDVLAQDQYGVTVDYALELKASLILSASGEYSGGEPAPFTGSDVSTLPGIGTYDDYGAFLPFTIFCGASASPAENEYVLQNIAPADLVLIGTIASNTPVYTLKDKNHPLDQGEFLSKKIARYGVITDQSSGDIPFPFSTLNEYVQKNPILIIQDPWNRLIGFGETEYWPDAGF